jgi:NAD(P)H-quinone oxidoreductase subunit 4
MSGFVSELMVFVGFATDDAYTLPSGSSCDGLAAIGVILTPIYLLSMLREIFYGKENVGPGLPHRTWSTPSPARST